MGNVFKTAVFGGFRKKDVIGYLEELGTEKQRQAENSDAVLAQLQQQMAASAGRLAAAEETAANLRSALMAKKEELERLERQCRQLQQENACLRESNARLEAERTLQQAQEQNSALQEKLAEDAGEVRQDAAAAIDEGLLHDLRQRLEEIIGELERLLSVPESKRSDCAKTTATKLGSVKDILLCVRGMNEK